MFGFAERSGRRSQAKGSRPRRSRSFQASLEAIEDRTLMSTLSAISWGSTSVLHNAVSAVGANNAGVVHDAVSGVGTNNAVGGVQSAVFAIGTNNAVYMNKDATGFVSLGGYALQISAGLDSAGNPEVYAIGGDNAVYVNHLTGGGWVDLGGSVTAISATVGNTVYAIGGGNAVYVNSGSGWVDLGSSAKAISAGLGAAGNPEVYDIGTNNAVYVNSGSGWVNQGGNMKAISATAGNTVYAIGTNNVVYVNSGSGWVDLGGFVTAISAGLDGAGRPEVYGIGGGNATYVNDNGSGWVDLGGYVVEISATTHGAVFARGELVTSIFASSQGSGFVSVGSTPLANPLADTSYSPAFGGTPLFNSSGPSYLDSAQGVVGDCWLLASLAEVADRDPQVIKNMFMYNGTTVDNGATVGLYTVQFYDGNGAKFGIQVDTELPSGGGYYDHPWNDMGTQTLWVALAEKAYAEANGLGLVTSSNVDRGSYDALNDGDPTWALQAITGIPANGYSINPTNIAAEWNAGCLIVLCTPNTPSSSYIVGDHCYAVVGYNASSSLPFEVFNPWGSNSLGWASSPGVTGTKYGLFTANAAFISQNFSSQSIGTGAINTDDPSGAANAIIELVTLDNARPKKAAIVQGSDSSNTAVSHTRPATVTGIDLDPQRLLG
jgi:Calpain family cysteine protease/Tectonin domain